jgi:hypothetical protein
MMEGVSFGIEFTLYADRARITDATGWIGDEITVAEGTYDQVRDEAHRLVTLAVDRGRCSKYANVAAGAELKRNITFARRSAQGAPRAADGSPSERAPRHAEGGARSAG